jgi:hypothetical protein
MDPRCGVPRAEAKRHMRTPYTDVDARLLRQRLGFSLGLIECHIAISPSCHSFFYEAGANVAIAQPHHEECDEIVR